MASSAGVSSKAAEIKAVNGVVAIKEEQDDGDVGEVKPKPKKRRKVVKAEDPESIPPSEKVSCNFWTLE